MKIIKTANKIAFELQNKKKIGFIPTMGCLHKGHVSLIKKSKKKKLLTVVSIFVNPLQFNNKKDFIKYPKTISTDLKICKKNKVDFVYLPQKKEIYPEKKIIIKNKIHFFKKVFPHTSLTLCMTNILKLLRIFTKNTSISCQTKSSSRRPVFPLAYVKTKIFSILETKKGIPKNPFSVSNQTQITTMKCNPIKSYTSYFTLSSVFRLQVIHQVLYLFLGRTNFHHHFPHHP